MTITGARRETFAHLRESEILRRLLHLPPSNGRKGPPAAGVVARPGSLPAQPTTELTGCLADPRFRAQPSVVDRYLFILGWVYQRDPQAFARVLDLRGHERHYFARSEQELRKYTSANPKPIPGSPYWADTRMDTGRKQEILDRVLKLVGYSDDARGQGVNALP
jgi:negative modulator of initiation of replication